MSAETPPYALTATQVLGLFRTNALTVEDYARSLLDRISERESTVKAWTYFDPELILSQARVLDQLSPTERGPLHGVAIGIKDVMNTKDMPTQFGSALYKGHQSGFDSSAVGILRAAGALIFGKTATTEFTVANSGPNTTNPHDPRRTPGGSSCGSAAAVADFHVPLTLGAQTGGSIIRPASYTGVFALKPTYNAISPEGQKIFSFTYDTFGFFSRSINDLQLVSDVFALEDDETPVDIPLGEAKIGLIKSPMWSRASPSTVAAMEKAVSILEKNGVHVEEVSLPFPPDLNDGDTLSRLARVIISGEAHSAFLREYRTGRAKIGPDIVRLVENHANFTQQERMRACDALSTLRPIFDKLATSYTAIITPSAIDEAPLGLNDMGSPAFNTLWTGLHVPVVNVPAFSGVHEMPIGVSLVTGRYRDQHLLKISKLLAEILIAEGGWKSKI